MISSNLFCTSDKWTALKSVSVLLTFVLFCLVISSTSVATEWVLVGPDSTEIVHNYKTSVLGQYSEVLCTNNGITLFQDDQWTEYSFGGLPVFDVFDTDHDTILLAMGDGTDSDGIYKFSLTDHQFHLVQWTLWTKFIHEHNGTFYFGTLEGLLRSENTSEWEYVPFFEDWACTAMESYDSNLYVSVPSNLPRTYYSHDNGETWNDPVGFAPWVDQMVYDNNGTLYGIFPDGFISSGMYCTGDAGLTWDVVFGSTYMTSLVMVHGNRQNFFVSWKSDDEIQRGVARYDRHNDLLLYMNDGLPCLSVNNLSYNNHIDCINVVACTDSGAYLTADLPELSVSEENALPAKISIETYPNPFNSSVAIKIDIPSTSDLTLMVYNLLGKQVASIAEGQYNPGFQTFHWKADEFPSGIYFIQFGSQQFKQVRKVVLMR